MRLIFAEKNGKFCEYAHMGTFQAKASFEKVDNPTEMTPSFIHGDEGSQLLLKAV